MRNLSQLTLEEKSTQFGSTTTAAVDRLGIPGYNWWQEASHGVANYGRSKKVTVFHQKIGLAVTWDTDLIRRVYTVVSMKREHDFMKANLISRQV